MKSSPAAALGNNRDKLSHALPEVRMVRETLKRSKGGRRDLVRRQWLQLISVVLKFKPELIVELGRGYINSLCAMALGTKLQRPGNIP